MTFKHVNGKGSIFKSDNKEKETSPDWSGDCMIANQQYWISAWVNESVKGDYIKLSFREKDVNRPAEKSRATNPLDDDIPFMRLPNDYR